MAETPNASAPDAEPGEPGPQRPPAAEAAWEARRLLRAARSGSLATSAQGQPFASLVTPATAPDLSVLMLLSTLSEHTRHLRADPRCALLATGDPDGPNPQTAPRVTITGLAEPDPDPALRARFLAVHPYATLYADFADFAIWRLRPAAALYVGGFARAVRLRAADLLPDAEAVASVAASEPGIITHCNDDHAEALAAIAGRPGPWRMVASDVDGCDLAQDETVIRIPWLAPAANSGAIRGELVRLTKAARS